MATKLFERTEVQLTDEMKLNRQAKQLLEAIDSLKKTDYLTWSKKVREMFPDHSKPITENEDKKQFVRKFTMTARWYCKRELKDYGLVREIENPTPAKKEKKVETKKVNNQVKSKKKLEKPETVKK